MPPEAPNLTDPLKHQYRRVSSRMGIRRDPFTGKQRMHAGIDLPVPVGTPVYAAEGGTVTHAGYRKGYGPTVDIAHQRGWKTRYAHLSKLQVKVGETVEKGQQVARSGNIGRSTGPHLHFELRDGNRPVDPLPHIGKAPHTGRARAFERAARTILDRKGKDTASGERSYRGLSYDIAQKDNTLSVSTRDERGEIFKIKDGQLLTNRLSHRDAAVFADVERQLKAPHLTHTDVPTATGLLPEAGLKPDRLEGRATGSVTTSGPAVKNSMLPNRKQQMALE